MFATTGDVAIITANGNLLAAAHRVTVGIDTQIHGGFAAAVTNRLHFS